MTNNRDISRWWSNLPVWRKQLIGLFTSELISIFGLVGVGAFLIIMGGRTVLVNQVKSELATTEINYNIKINQMRFGFRGQSDNISAAKAYKESQVLNS
ncbi:MAG: histidine kinase, partial [Cyanobacteria bacterium J06649_11]